MHFHFRGHGREKLEDRLKGDKLRQWNLLVDYRNQRFSD
jgi:hypothetical protein